MLDAPALLLRALAAETPDSLAPQPLTPAASATTVDILVVDDSLSVRRGLAQILRDAGYAVATARDGVDAIGQMTAALPRLLILDIEMPQLNGYELLDVLRTHGPFRSVRAMMLTSRAAPRFREEAMKLGAVDYLVKPIAAEQLLDAVSRTLAQQ
jgi:CheY-like chemotaxis protein